MSSPLTALNPERPQESAPPLIPVVPLLRRTQQEPRPPRPDRTEELAPPDMPVDPEPESGPGQPQVPPTTLDGNPFAMALFRPAAPQDLRSGAGRTAMSPAFLRGTGVHAESAAAPVPVGDPAPVRSLPRQAARVASPHGARTVAATGDHTADAVHPLPASDAARTAGPAHQDPPADPPAPASDAARTARPAHQDSPADPPVPASNAARARDGGQSAATADALSSGVPSSLQGDDPSLLLSGARRARHDSEQGGPIPHLAGRAGAESASTRPSPHTPADGAGRRPGGQPPAAARADAAGADLPPAAAPRMATVSVPFSSWGPGHRVTASWLPGALAGLPAAPVVLRGSSENAQRAIGAALAADEGTTLGHLQVIAADAPEDGTAERRAARHLPEDEE